MPKFLKLEILKLFMDEDELRELLESYKQARRNTLNLTDADWKLYKSFLAGDKSVRACAKEWGISPSSAFYRLKKMEESLCHGKKN